MRSRRIVPYAERKSAEAVVAAAVLESGIATGIASGYTGLGTDRHAAALGSDLLAVPYKRSVLLRRGVGNGNLTHASGLLQTAQTTLI